MANSTRLLAPGVLVLDETAPNTGGALLPDYLDPTVYKTLVVLDPGKAGRVVSGNVIGNFYRCSPQDKTAVLKFLVLDSGGGGAGGDGVAVQVGLYSAFYGPQRANPSGPAYGVLGTWTFLSGSDANGMLFTAPGYNPFTGVTLAGNFRQFAGAPTAGRVDSAQQFLVDGFAAATASGRLLVDLTGVEFVGLTWLTRTNARLARLFAQLTPEAA